MTKSKLLENDPIDKAWTCLRGQAIQAGMIDLAIEKSLETGSSFACEDAFGRDGCFDDKDVFLIFEKPDLEAFRSYIEAAILL